MKRKRRARNTWYLALVGIAASILVIGLLALEPETDPIRWIIRGAALLGYLFVFLSITSSACGRKLVRFFGRPFVQVHHVLSVAGLVMVTLHPLGFAWLSKSLRVLIPIFSPWTAFLAWGGRVALYLIGVAVLAAVLRRTISRRWRVIHFLNYGAFLLATPHAILRGTDFQHLFMRVVAIGMLVTATGVFIRKRIRTRRR